MLSHHLSQTLIDPLFSLSQHRRQFLYLLITKPYLVLYLSLVLIGQLH